MNSVRSTCAAFLVAGFLGGCSLLGLDKIPQPTCTQSSQCEPLNQRNGIAADACQRFQCVTVTDGFQTGDRICRLAPRDFDGDGDPSAACRAAGTNAVGADCDDDDANRSSLLTETCDGADNDCDGTIDEDVAPTAAPSVLLDRLDEDARVEAVQASTGTGYLVIAPAQRLGVGLSQPAQLLDVSGAATATQFAWQSNSSARPFSEWVPSAATCPLPGPGTTGACGMNDAAFAELGPVTSGGISQWLLLSVDRVSCPGGQLRTGVFVPGTPTVEAVGPARLSPASIGVGSLSEAACTGQTAARIPAGASAPHVAPLPRLPNEALPQAIGVWRGGPAAANACSSTPVPVEAAVFWLETATLGATSRTVVNATGVSRTGDPDCTTLPPPEAGLRPAVLGNTVGADPIGVTALPDKRGYVVAFAETDLRAVRLVFVPPVDPTMAEAQDADPDHALRCATWPRRTPALTTVDLGSVPLPRTGVPVGHVRVTWRRKGTALALGLAWQLGCDPASASAWFTEIDLDGFSPGSARVGALRQLGGGGASAPDVVWAPAGVSVVGSGSGTTRVTDANDGAWVLSWVDGALLPAGVRVARLAERTGEFVDAQPATFVAQRPARDAVLFPPVLPRGAVRVGVRTVSGLQLRAATCAPTGM